MSNLELLLQIVDEAFDLKSWHGTNLRGSIRGLSAEQVAWRAQPARKNIHEIVLHCAYWKYTVRRRLTGEKRGSFSLPGSNWFTRPTDDRIDPEVWKADVRLLVEMHANMRETIAQLSPTRLTKQAPGGSTTILQLITGIAAHDLYHAGQIQTIKRLFADAKSTN